MIPSETPTLSLDEQICFALYSASRSITSRYRELLDPLGLTYPQYLVFVVLWHEGALSVSQLGERLALDSGTLSPLLRRLEKSGLIARERGTADERVVMVSLTPSGSDLRAEAAGIPAAICASTGLQLPELQALTQQLASLTDHVRSTPPRSTPARSTSLRSAP
ncbi:MULTISPECIES: MarR family winged helix-turn-helix transcriptional regulator [Subtercola]|uniref:MarR family transcriptional regulator n=1 Tax=Subtercola vilae TaxID=2056433 RepID=A0A4T2CD97_9MICO|nr:MULTISPECIES: MarR family transcriptional regulator [Subtercola]MEA9983858.1 MarR family transcriptional regulator [Subtercola sp. RTI3]TIH40606.1 MarR family transcriptional regulator [Subtercola vilae]